MEIEEEKNTRIYQPTIDPKLMTVKTQFISLQIAENEKTIHCHNTQMRCSDIHNNLTRDKINEIQMMIPKR